MYLIDQLRAAEPAEGGVVPDIAFFFCSSGDARRSSGIGVLQGLLYHLCKNGRFLQLLNQEYEAYRPPRIDVMNDFTRLWAVFEKCTQDPAASGLVIVIDGLDECDATSRDQLLKCFAMLTSRRPSTPAKFKMMLSCRHERHIPRQLMSVAEHLSTDPAAISGDLQRFVRERVAELGRSLQYSADVRERLERELLNKHGDTFLWLETVTRHVATSETGEMDVLKHIRGLPGDLPALYDKILLEIPRERFEDTYFLLNILAVSFRELTKDEVLTAFHLRSSGWTFLSDTDWHRDEHLFSRCSDLVVLDPRTETVRFFNESVREYLTGSLRDGQPPVLVLTYVALLLFVQVTAIYFGPRLLRFRDIAVILAGLASFWTGWQILSADFTVMLNLFPHMMLFVSRLPGLNSVRLRHHVNLAYAHFWMFRISFKRLGHTSITAPRNLAMATYARQFLHQHAVACPQLTAWFFPWLAKRHYTISYLASLDLWLRQAAASGGTFVPQILRAGGDPNASDARGWTALRWAAASNDLEGVKRLLQAGANPDQRDVNGETSIMWMIGAPVERVIYENVDIAGDEFAALMSNPGLGTPRTTVAWSGNIRNAIDGRKHGILAEMINHSQHIDDVDLHGRTSLHRAASMHDWEAILALLRAGANPNEPDGVGATPLLLALRAPRNTFVFQDINVRQAAPAFLGSFVGPRKPDEPLTPLNQGYADRRPVLDAAIAGLLRGTQNLDAVDEEGRTALSYAVENGDAAVVAMLMKGNQHSTPSRARPDALERTPLLWACCHPRFRVLKFERLNIMDSAHVYLGAIHVADPETDIGGGSGDEILSDDRRRIVAMLLDADVDVDHADIEGHTALALARQNGLDEVDRLLLTSGAHDPDERNPPVEEDDRCAISCQQIVVSNSAKLMISTQTRINGLTVRNSAQATYNPPPVGSPQETAAMEELVANCPRTTFDSISVENSGFVVLGSSRNAACSMFRGDTIDQPSAGRLSFSDIVVANSARWHCDLDIPEAWRPAYRPSFAHLLSLPRCIFTDIVIQNGAKVEMGNTVVVRHQDELWVVTSQHPGNTFRRISIENAARVRSSMFTAMQANGIARWTIVALLGWMQRAAEPG